MILNKRVWLGLAFALGQAFFYGTPSWAIQELPFHPSLKRLIEDRFFSAGKISPEKLSKYRESVLKSRDEVFQNLFRYYHQVKRLSRSDSEKKARKEDLVENFDLVIQGLRELQSNVDSSETRLYLKIAELLEIEDSLRVSGMMLDSIQQWEFIKQSFRSWRIPRRSPITNEATNLVDPSSGKFLEFEDLARLQESGVDLSKLDPNPQSPFWVQQNISQISVRGFFEEGQAVMQRGLKTEFPRENKGFFKAIRRTQTKPKLDVLFRDSSGKLAKIKLKIAREIHSEPTAAALASTLGFHVDVSRHVEDFKLILGEMSYSEFKKEWNSYYSKYDLEKYVKSRGRDAEGNFVVFYRGLFESKPEGLNRVVSWAWGELGHSGVRETRALILFNQWIANADLKEAENNKLIIRGEGEQRKLFFSQHDLGFAFGDIFRETPGQFPWDLVSSNGKDYIDLNYRSFQPNSGFDHITFSDARWTYRLIGQLTREQITEAVSLGRWPKAMEALIVEKLIHRRNQMIFALGLQDEIPLLSVNRRLSTSDGVVKDGDLKEPWVAGYPEKFEENLWDTASPVIRKIRDALVRATTNAVSGVSQLDLDPIEIGFDMGLVNSIKVKITREVQENPNPKSDQDRYLVKDVLGLGFELGAGLVVGGRVSLMRNYTLVYPKPTYEQAQYAGKFLFNLLIPYSAAVGKLPENHILMVEDVVEGGGLVQFETPVPIGLRGTVSRVLLSRSIISRKEDQIRLYRDTSFYNELAARLHVRLALVKLPIAKQSVTAGKINRVYYETALSQVLSLENSKRILNVSVSQGDFSELNNIAKKKEISSQFFESINRISLFGMMVSESRYRVDRLSTKIADVDGSSQESSKSLQAQSVQKSGWYWFDNGETFTRRFKVQSVLGSQDEAILDPEIRMEFEIRDRDTRNDELGGKYLTFIDEIAGEKNFVPFTPERHSRTVYWGEVNTRVNVVYGPEAIRKLLSATYDELYPIFSEVLLSRGIHEKQYYEGFLRFLTDEMRKARLARAESGRVLKVLAALKHSVVSEYDGPQGLLLGVLNQWIGYEKIYLSALVTYPPDRENKFPEGKPLFRESGSLPEGSDAPIVFAGVDALEIWGVF